MNAFEARERSVRMSSMPLRIRAALSLALLLVPMRSLAATYRNFVAQVPAAPDSTQSVRVWMDSDTAFGETAAVEAQIGGVYTRYDGTFDPASYPGANWYADIPAQPAGTVVQYQLFTLNESAVAYGFTGFDWSYTVVDVDAGAPADAAVDDALEADALEDVADAGDDALDASVADAPEDGASDADAEPADVMALDAIALDAAADVPVDTIARDGSADTATIDSESSDTGAADAAGGDAAVPSDTATAGDSGSDASQRDVVDSSVRDARADASSDAPSTTNAGGACNCRAAGAARRSHVTAILAVVALALGRRRRRRRSAPAAHTR
jgi:MYXO-CTERM domain-containing protein